MAGQSKVTTDHRVIQQWIEDRGGKPATVKRTESDDDPGLLRVDFPGYGRDESRHSLEEISWDDFFQKFDEKELAFLYQDEMKSGQPSRFFKFVSRETAEKKEDQNHERSESKGKK
jgi:hypothetical protein